MQKFLVESLKLSLFLATVAYCMLSVGFTSQHSSVNNSLLFDACFKYESSKTMYEERSLENRINDQNSKELQASLGGPLTGIRLNNLEFQKAAASADSTIGKNSFGISDSLRRSRVDTLKKRVFAPVDSSARIKYFRYTREDEPYVSFQPKKKSKFFAYPSPSLASRTVTLDSSGTYVIVKEQIAGKDTKTLLEIPLEEYIKLRIDANNKSSWEALAYKYELKNEETDLSTLISDITNIDIPLPSAGFLSIFGPPKINIKIGGAVDIHGAWRNETQEGYTASLLGNTRNEPDFKQQVQINVNGTIGDKLKIGADWNTERTFEYENQLKLNYTGYEDEIVKSVEAGNVSLQTSPLVGGSEALFGVKANFQLGPLSLTALASQKKGEVKEVSVSGGASSQPFEIEVWNYSKNHYFIDSVYADTVNNNIFNAYYGNAIPDLKDDFFVEMIEVWKSTNTTIEDRAKERNVNAYMYLPARNYSGPLYTDINLRSQIQTIAGIQETGRFVLLQPDVDYTFNKNTGVISFSAQIQEDDAIAVAFKRKGNDNTFGEFINEFPDNESGKTVILKLVKPKNLIPQYKSAWQLQLKNIYPVGGRNIDDDGFELDITYYNPDNGAVAQNEINGVKLLRAFGLDKYDKSGTGSSDGIFDFNIGSTTILPTTGEIIFPYLQPFGKSFPKSLGDTATYAFQAIYESKQSDAKENIKNKFKIVGKYSGTSSSTFSIGFNVVENSVKVLLGGRQLTPGTDYVVDYNIGQVTIRNDAAVAPGADLRITYEQNDLFQLASKTLVGIRGNLDIAEKTNLGFSFLRLNQETLSEKVRIGEEPLANSILGMDFGTELDLPFVTRGLNNIISTRAMSSIKVNGEFAYMSPDPNTKRSTIASDNNKSIAFIDDFEGTKRSIPIGVSYSAWKDLSRPAFAKEDSGITISTKAKSYWYNRLNPSDAYVKDIWGEDNKKVAQGEDQVTVLNFVYYPHLRGPFNSFYRSTFADSAFYHWGGMMKSLSSSAQDLEEENIEFIEFWFNMLTPPSQTDTLYIDLGRISEDTYEGGKSDKPDNEDFIKVNSLIDEGEDLGIDRIPDQLEPYYNAQSNPDPNGDNWNGPYNYPSVNGTEGNAKQQGGNYVDTEDLNRNGNIDRANSFFRYKMPLDTSRTTNPYIVGGGAGNQRWFQVRIPIRDKRISEPIGSPTLSNVEAIRFWFKGIDDSVHMRFAEMNLVGNQWEKIYPLSADGKTVDKNDSVMVVSVINKEDNPFEYERIPGVISEVDHTTKGDVERNEQSLNLIIKGLEDGRERQAIKYLFRPLDVFSYKEMKLYIHGDRRIETNISSPSPIDTNNYNAEVYFRFGSDTTNYYEYRMPVETGWEEISIMFNELTSLKQKADTSKNFINSKQIEGKPGHFYAIRGRPALTNINIFSVGIRNPRSKGTSDKIFGEVWVNELRVIGADDTKGWAYSSSVNLKLADLMTVNFNISQTDPYFHKLSDRFGSRSESRNWGGSVDLDVLKFLPVNLPGSNLRINYSRNEHTAKPLYKPGTDINVESAAQQMIIQNSSKGETEAKRLADEFVNSTRTINTSETWSLSSIKIKVPSNNWLIKETINNLTFGFNFNKTNGRSPTIMKTNTWVWNANIDYSLSFSQKNFFYLTDIPYIGSVFKILKDYKGIRIFYTPQSFSGGIKATRNYSFSQSRITGAGSSGTTSGSLLPTISRDFKTVRDAGFDWMITDGGLLNVTIGYNLNIAGSLAHLLTDQNKVSRRDSKIWNDIFSGEFFGKPYQFLQSFEFRTNPRLPSIWDLNKFFTITAGYTSSYNWQNSFEQKELGRSASFTNRINTGLNIKLKSLFEPMFEEEKETSRQKTSKPSSTSSGRGSRGRESRFEEERIDQSTEQDKEQDTEVKDSTKTDFVEFQSDSSKPGKMQTSMKNAFKLFKSIIHWTLIDYETIRFNFTQDNQVQKTGLKGEGSGLANFWGLSQNYNNGPSRAFMLGLSQNVGERIRDPKATLPENYSQKNTIEFSTSRPLWTGAQLELKWRVGWGVNKSSSLRYDSTSGNFQIINPSSTGSIDRSFLALPPVVFLPFLKGGLKKVHELYDPGSSNLSSAFIEGFETLPFLSKLPILASVAKYVPRPNWSISWDGLEKFSFLKSFTKRVGLTHSYNSSYSEGWKIESNGEQIIQFQKITYGFQPLLGLNLTFNSLWEGNLSGSIKYSTKNGYDLSPQTNSITETFSTDVGITASYSKSGLEVPIFGIYLKNDIEASFSYSSSVNAPTIYNMSEFSEKGTPQDQTMRTTMEPRIKMVISSKVTASIFYKRSVFKPLEGSTSRNQGTTTNEYGLDVRITIQ